MLWHIHQYIAKNLRNDAWPVFQGIWNPVLYVLETVSPSIQDRIWERLQDLRRTDAELYRRIMGRD